MVQIENLCKSYDSVKVIDHVSLSIRRGVITGLLGPNGAGKTTLISILMALIAKDGGNVTINGLSLDREPDKIRTISSIVPQTLALYPTLTAYENLEYFGALYGLKGKTLQDRIERSIDIASLQSFVHKATAKFSGGMKRRLNLAIGLLNDPLILYLDEPTVGVDAQSRSYMLEMIKNIREEQGTTIVYTSHYMDEIEQVSDDIAIIDAGKIVLHGRKDDVLNRATVMKITVEGLDDKMIERLKRIPGVDAVAGQIRIDKDDRFHGNLTQVFSLLEDNRLVIRKLSFGSENLEELFLKLTHAHLRDE
jgi:ABC-2 type transport system ATP-binding protein